MEEKRKRKAKNRSSASVKREETHTHKLEHNKRKTYKNRHLSRWNNKFQYNVYISCFLLLDFLYLSFRRRHRHPCPMHRCCHSLVIQANEEAAKGKMLKANNCIQLFPLCPIFHLRFAFTFSACTPMCVCVSSLFAHHSICKLHVVVLFLCCHCKAHSLYYNCHF